MRIRPLLSFLLPLLWLTVAFAEPYEKVLSNGLKVVVQEDRRAPTAVQMLWYRVGSMDEVDGQSGVAHVLEHMMFKGTPKVGPGEFNKRVAAVGGRDNAFTSRDYTAYFQQVPREQLETVMALEADRLQHLTVDDEAFAQEIRVVMEERRMRTDDNPQAKLFEQMNAVAWQAHPYRRPIIGWMNDLEHMTAADARDWYRTWYTPNNATLVVAGDVDHQQVFEWAERYYGPTAARSLPARKPQTEPEQMGVRRLTVKAPAKLPMLVMGYKVPLLRDIAQDRAPYALEMLAAILDGHDAARFNQSLVRQQRLAVSAGVEYDSTARGPGMLYLHAMPAEGKSVSVLEAALRAEIRRIQEHGVTAAELKRAKAQLIASQVYKQDSVFGQVMEIGQLEILGFSWRDHPRIWAQLQSVTAAEVQEVARKYFGDDALTVAVLEPQPMPDQARRPGAAFRH